MPAAATAALGIGTGMIQDLWQLGIGNQMADQQMGRTKQLMNFQQQKALEMWEKTGYGATVEQIKKAGLNPALLYGMGGAGGQSSQAPTATAPMQATPNNMGMGIQSAAQLQLLQAQKENIEADTANKKAGVPKTQAETKGINLANDYQTIQNEIAGKTIDAAIVTIQESANKLASEAQEAANKQEISSRTLEDQIDTIVANRQKAIIEKDLAEMMKGKTQTEIAKLNQDIQNGITALKQQAEQIKISGGQLEQEKIRTAFETNLGNRLSVEAVKALGGLANMYIGRKTLDVNTKQR